MKKEITIQDIHVGTLFCKPDYKYPHNALMEVVGVEYNKDAGKPVKDQWGGVVWETPLATIKARNTATGETSGFAVQSKTHVLSDWLTFVDSKEDYERLMGFKSLMDRMVSYRTNENIIREFCEKNLSEHTDWTGTRVETKCKCASVEDFVRKLMEHIEEHHGEC